MKFRVRLEQVSFLETTIEAPDSSAKADLIELALQKADAGEAVWEVEYTNDYVSLVDTAE